MTHDAPIFIVGANRSGTTLLRLILNALAGDPRPAFVFEAPEDNGVPPGSDATPSIDFAIADVPPGDYLVRVSVDGAETVPSADDPTDFDPLNPDKYGEFDSPRITI